MSGANNSLTLRRVGERRTFLYSSARRIFPCPGMPLFTPGNLPCLSRITPIPPQNEGICLVLGSQLLTDSLIFIEEIDPEFFPIRDIPPLNETLGDLIVTFL